MMLFLRTTLLLVLAVSLASAQRLTPLATQPDWSSLEKFQGTITKEEFTSLLTQVYAPRGASNRYFTIKDDGVEVVTSPGKPPFRLQFATEATGAKPVPRYWHKGSSLRGLRIALDPGHLGGRWA
ncbi:MAG: hypothetical protein JHC52_07755, partial [Chthoniobacterales bacterium]|nr:hypothetical protein [Chthoniobacterales bacterium]